MVEAPGKDGTQLGRPFKNKNDNFATVGTTNRKSIKADIFLTEPHEMY